MTSPASAALRATPRPDILARLAGWWRRSTEAWSLQRRRRAQERRLPELDEATLRDLGLARGELLSYWAESERLVETTRQRVLMQLDRRLGL